MTKLARRIVEVGALAAALVAGGCGGDDDPSVMIVSPTNESTLTIADDADPGLDGIQVAVEVAVENEADEEEVWLYTDATILADMPDAEPTLVGTLLDGAVTFEPTLEPGTHDLLACVRDCQFRSQQVQVTVVAGCGGIAFVVYLTATEAEVIRIGSDLRWSSEMMAGRAVEALAQVSDCTFRAGTLRAQPTVVRGRIACPGPSPAPSA